MTEKDHGRGYICIALSCVVVLILYVMQIAITPPKPKTSKQTKERIATLEAEVQELRAAK